MRAWSKRLRVKHLQWKSPLLQRQSQKKPHPLNRKRQSRQNRQKNNPVKQRILQRIRFYSIQIQ